MLNLLPDHTRLWTFIADTNLPQELSEELLKRVREFLPSWHSHARSVYSDVAVEYDRVLLVGGYLKEGAPISGCGIDQMTRAVDAIAAELDITWISPLNVVVEGETGLVSLNRLELMAAARDGSMDSDTRVVVATHETVEELRTHGLMQPAGDTWLGNILPLGVA